MWYYEKNPSTQSTVQFNKLGQTASHGCIRLSVGDAKWIYDNCALGTKAVSYTHLDVYKRQEVGSQIIESAIPRRISEVGPIRI